jgi:hypothetical protein
MTRKLVTAAVATLVLTAGAHALWAQQTAKKAGAAKPQVTAGKVYLTPTCGCCSKWVDHMKAAGLDLEREVTTELEKVVPRQKVPAKLRSCHTAVVGKYVIEGHVPADIVQKLLKDNTPGVVGLSAPNMPVGSPGMEGPGARPYPIVAFKADGSTIDFATVTPR